MAASSRSAPDDAPEVVKARLVAYDRQTKPVSDYYRQHGVLVTVDGEASIEEVSNRVEQIVESAAASRDGHL